LGGRSALKELRTGFDLAILHVDVALRLDRAVEEVLTDGGKQRSLLLLFLALPLGSFDLSWAFAQLLVIWRGREEGFAL